MVCRCTSLMRRQKMLLQGDRQKQRLQQKTWTQTAAPQRAALPQQREHPQLMSSKMCVRPQQQPTTGSH